MDLMERLNHIFYPGSVAVIGASASPEKVGYVCVSSLLEGGFKGKVYPVNPRLSQVLGLTAYPAIGAVPGTVDLAMIVIPAPLTIPAIEECAARGVKGAIVISGGFKEVSTDSGRGLQDRLRDIARRSGMTIIGPNTMGIVNPRANLVASFQSTLGMSRAGSVAVVAQSGGLCIYITHALINHDIGVSKVVGLGNRCSLDFDEVVAYLLRDEETRVIILYVEGLEQPQRLLQIAREGVKRKPILVYKGGRGEGSSRATFSHTGALAGRHELYRAAFTQSGMIAADSITELVDAARALNLQPPAAGNRVAIASVQAGPAIVIADRCHELGLRLAELSPATRKRLRELIPPLNAVDNPVDIAWKSDEFDSSRDILKAILEDDGVDALIVAAVFYPSNMELMRATADIAGYRGKPVLACLDSPGGLASGQLQALEQSRVPTYPLPERAATGMASLVSYGGILKTRLGGEDS